MINENLFRTMMRSFSDNPGMHVLTLQLKAGM